MVGVFLHSVRLNQSLPQNVLVPDSGEYSLIYMENPLFIYKFLYFSNEVGDSLMLKAEVQDTCT